VEVFTGRERWSRIQKLLLIVRATQDRVVQIVRRGLVALVARRLAADKIAQHLFVAVIAVHQRLLSSFPQWVQQSPT
jgi:hypothetical protein